MTGLNAAPQLQGVDPDYLGKDVSKGEALLGLAYQKPDFTLADKTFLMVTIVCVWVAVCAYLLRLGQRRRMLKAAIVGCMGVLLCWNYSTSILDNGNDRFDNFQRDSESLVSSVIESVIKSNVTKTSSYGLGRIEDVVRDGLAWKEPVPISDESWTKGYSKTEPKIRIKNNNLTRAVTVEGNVIRFANGVERRIEKVEKNGENLQ